MAGELSGANISFDNNEIMARNNGETSTLHLQYNGGDLTVNNNQFTVNNSKVGIGTDTSEYKLDVRGNRIQLKGAYTNDWIAMRTDGGDPFIWSTVNPTHTGVEASGRIYDFRVMGPGINYTSFTGAHDVELNDDFPGTVIPGCHPCQRIHLSWGQLCWKISRIPMTGMPETGSLAW